MKGETMQALKRCSKCTLPETHETIFFDKEGVCNICHQHEYKKEHIDWAKKKEEFRVLLEKYRGKYAYDCIVPFSGGKDSTFTLFTLINDWNLKPLVVSFDHGFYRPLVETNKLQTYRKLGVDVLKFTPNWHIVKKLMLESLKRKGVISSIAVNLNYKALGFENPIFVQIRTEVSKNKDLIKKLAALDYVAELYQVLGEYNMVAKIIVQDLDAAEKTIAKLGTLDGILDLKTLVVLSELKHTCTVPSEALQKKL